MRVAIIGAGAMGAIYGAALTEAGLETVLVDVSPTVVDRLNRDGLIIVGAGEKRTVYVKAATPPVESGPVDIVMFFVKCYQTDSAALAAMPLVGPETVVVSLQNGLGNGDILAQRYMAKQIVVGVTYHSATVLEPGIVAHTAVGSTCVGPYDGTSMTAPEHLASTLAGSSVHAIALKDVQTEIWKKLVLTSALLPTSALTGMTAAALGRDEAMVELVEGLTTESTKVARRAGFDIEESEQIERVRHVIRTEGEGKSSMLQDVESGRRTEIDVINGAIVREGLRHGGTTLLNRTMVALVKGYERARRAGEGGIKSA
jgi:2-dehydropantoate 2-reductase